jgi:hypothetical protein
VAAKQNFWDGATHRILIMATNVEVRSAGKCFRSMARSSRPKQKYNQQKDSPEWRGEFHFFELYGVAIAAKTLKVREKKLLFASAGDHCVLGGKMSDMDRHVNSKAQ